ncbi:MAG: PA2778 family cysteine peptidase [Bdellovibrionota bacterium]
MRLLSLILFFLCVSCATRTPVTDRLTDRKKDLYSHKISDVPLIAQKENHCGPASLAMVMQFHGIKKNPDEIAKGLFHEKLKGSFFPEMKARARDEGMVVIEVNDLEDAFKELSAGNPVIVLQNNGFAFFPRWHFAVLTGFDLKGPDVYLHDGSKEVEEDDMRLFERSFVLGGKRSLVILPPGKLSVTGTEMNHLESATILEGMNKKDDALKSYQAILTKWPESLLARIGASNVLYFLGRKKEAMLELESAVISHPDSAFAWHNLAIIQGESGNKELAKLSAKKALSLASDEQKEKFKVSLSEWL